MRSVFALMQSGMQEQDLKMWTNLTTNYFPSTVVETVEDATMDATQQ